MRNSGVDHLDVVVSDLERSLAFYRGLLEPLGYARAKPGLRREPATRDMAPSNHEP